MRLLEVLVIISSLSFLGYGTAYFVSAKIKREFVRFGLKKYGALTAILELLGSLGLLVGLMSDLILMISSGGLALLMFLGLGVRMKIKDDLLAMLPAFIFFVLNLYIFWEAIK